MIINVYFIIIYIYCVDTFFQCINAIADFNEPWNLPVLPSTYPISKLGNATSNKRIPRYLWIAVRNLDDGLNHQMPALFGRNKNWDIHVCSNAMKDEFMNRVFANTSLLWAYNIIAPSSGAAKADLWRYAVLWIHGGVYIDDDSDMHSPLDNMIDPKDELIVSYEKNGFNGNRCYIPKYHLSDFYTYRNASKRAKNIFHNRILLNWAMAAAPHHPIIQATMENAVEIIKHEYFRDSLLRSLHAAYRWEVVMCATCTYIYIYIYIIYIYCKCYELLIIIYDNIITTIGPSLLTGTARELVLQDTEGQHVPKVSYKLAHNDFKDYGGRFKAVSNRPKDDPKHYMNALQNQKTELLSSYLPEPGIEEIYLKNWEGQPVQGQNDKEIFVMDHGVKRSIPNYDTFMALNFTMADVNVISDKRVHSIKTGKPMPQLDYTGSYDIHR